MKTNTEILMKNNVLIKARYNLTLIQSRIFIIMLYKLQRDNSGAVSCFISTQEFKQIINNKNQQSPKEITKILEQFMSETISFKTEKEDGKGSIWSKYNLINGYDYDDVLDLFRIECSPRVYELLMSYLDMNGYTPINLKIWMSLNNTSAQRLYDLLRLWSNTKNVITYEIDELRELFMLENKYTLYGDFKKKVIMPAVKALNKTKMFEIETKENKKGRKVNSIDFKVKDLDKRKYFQQEFNLNSDRIEIIDELDIPDKDVYVPYEDKFTNGSINCFKQDFNKYDFSQPYLKEALLESISIVMEKENKPKVYMSAYKYFKGVLNNKINDAMKNIEMEQEHQEEMNFFDNYNKK